MTPNLDELERLAKEAKEIALGYFLTPDGAVYSKESNWRGYGVRKLTPVPNSHGYLRVRLQIGETRKSFFIHTLVAHHFHGPKPSPNHEVCHRDGTRTNNHASNLYWGTRKENARDRKLHGREMAAANGRTSAWKTAITQKRKYAAISAKGAA